MSSLRKRGTVPVSTRRSSASDKHSSKSSGSSSHHKTHRSSNSSSSQKLRYELTLMTPLPEYLTSNTSFQAEYLVTSTSSKTSSKKHLAKSPPSNLLAVISLTTPTPHSSSSTQPLQGPSLVSSLHALPESYIAQLPSDLQKRARGYVSFPDLSVTSATIPGTYELGVALVKVPSESGTSCSGRRGREIKTVGAAGTWSIGVY